MLNLQKNEHEHPHEKIKKTNFYTKISLFYSFYYDAPAPS
mgnify:CR=1 FL=1